MRLAPTLVCLCTCSLVPCLVACGPSSLLGDAASGADGTPSSDAGQDDPPPLADAHPADPLGTTAVYAHTDLALFRVDPASLQVILVGSFQWPEDQDDPITDIAVDQRGRMVGVSFDKVYEIDPRSARCTLLSTLQGASFNGLTFVPDPEESHREMLVGASRDGAVYEVDPATGAVALIGEYGSQQGEKWGNSGDLVAVQGAGIFATVTREADVTDSLARLDPRRAFAATIIGDTGLDSIWGLGFWGGKLYGFSEHKQLVLIDPQDAQITPVANASLRWWGAGVTTVAPVIE